MYEIGQVIYLLTYLHLSAYLPLFHTFPAAKQGVPGRTKTAQQARRRRTWQAGKAREAEASRTRCKWKWSAAASARKVGSRFDTVAVQTVMRCLLYAALRCAVLLTDKVDG